MLRQALRRLFWLAPTLIGVTLASFVLVSYIPGPVNDPNVLAALGEERANELRRSRFLDLPRFFNKSPIDVRIRVSELIDQLRTNASAIGAVKRSFSRLGGAALPFVLPQLDALEPEMRARLALALSPIAERMGLRAESALDPVHAVAFWNRFWSDRALDFRSTNAYRAVRRFSEHATIARQTDLLELDSFVLEPLILELSELAARLNSRASVGDIQTARDLIDVASHLTGRDDPIDASSTRSEALSCIRRWQLWWLVHTSDYLAYDGASRLLAMFTETQYAKWAQRIVLFGFSDVTGGEDQVGHMLHERAPTTLFITLGAMLMAYTVAALLPLVARMSNADRRLDWLTTLLSIGVYAVPTACLAGLLAPRVGGAKLVGAICTLAVGLVASPLMQQQTWMRQVETQDHVRLGAAYGLSRKSVALRHTLRHALVPTVSLFSVDLPVAFGGAFVVEAVFDIHGLGEQTIRAVQANDVAWLVGLAFVSALVVTSGNILCDVLVMVLDPRISAHPSRDRSKAR